MPACPPIPPVKFLIPYESWTTEEARKRLDQARSEVSGLNSAAVNSRVLSEPPGGAFIYAISEAVEKNKELRNAEITKALIHRVVTATNNDAIVDPTIFAFLGIYYLGDDHPDPRSWEAPLLGILNLVEPEALKEDGKFNLEIVKPILAAFPDMMKPIWQDLSNLLHEGTIGDYRRCLVARTIYMISQIPGQRSKMYDVTTISLAMHCWIYMSPNPTYRLSASACTRYLFYQTEEVPPPPRGVIQFALKAISAETFISREKAVLESPELLGFPLEMEFKALDPFTGSTLSCSQIFSDTKFYIHIVDALYKQLMEVESALEYDSAELQVFSEGHRLILNFLKRNPKAQSASFLLRDIIRHTRIIRVGAAGFYMASKEEALNGDWFTFFWILSRVANPVIPPRDWPFYPVENILNDIRNALRHVFYSTSLGLTSSTDSSKKYCALWEKLGDDYKIDPDSTLRFCKAQRRCCNLFCYRSAVETEKLRCCKRCKETYYCGKQCQKLHWSDGHKSQCGQAILCADQDSDDEMPPNKFVFPMDKTPDSKI